MWSENYRWHFDYIRLAWDTSFTFEKQKTGNLDKSKICLIDIERIIEERDFASVERYIPTVIQYALEGEQAAVLDSNFVKIFRISQLSVQYLLFCKKYLDNTVVLLKDEINKLKEENKELKGFNGELKEHVNMLIRKLKQQKSADNSAIHKCEKCGKLFSTEQYLSAHMKRRHSTGDQESVSAQNETDKLQSEIKMLKERLNSTERLIQQEQKTVEPVDKPSDTQVLELQQKFELWKMQVENELRLMQTQKNFEEKYEKWFENILETLKESLPGNKKNVEVKEVDTQAQEYYSNDSIKTRRESTTQTDLQDISSVNTEMISTLPQENKVIGEKGKTEKEVLPLIQEQMNKIEESVNTKVATSFHRIESQLDSFWNKLNEFEGGKKQIEEISQVTDESEERKFDHREKEHSRPFVKPRTKFQKYNEDESQPEITQINSENVHSHKRYIQVNSRMSGDTNVINRSPVEGASYVKAEHPVQQNPEGGKVDYSPTLSTGHMQSKEIRSQVDGVPIQHLDRSNAPTTKSSAKGHTFVELYKSTEFDSQISDDEKSEISTESDTSTGPSSDAESHEPVVPVRKKQSENNNRLRLDKPVVQVIVKETNPKMSHHSKYSINKPQAKSIEEIKNEIDVKVSGKLQELGISPQWQGLGEKPFRRAMEIIKYQQAMKEKHNTLLKRMKKRILQKVNQLFQLSRRKTKKQSAKPTPRSKPTSDGVQKVNVHAVIENKSKNLQPKQIRPRPSSALPSKNEDEPKKMYESDSEDSDRITKVQEIHHAAPKISDNKDGRPYSAVIRELKMKSSKIIDSDDESIPVEHVYVDHLQGKSDDIQQTKGVLKSHPSVGSLSKKKVLFDLESDLSQVEDKAAIHQFKDEGSTTSINSSVLEGTPRAEAQKQTMLKNNKEIEDLSDFDF